MELEWNKIKNGNRNEHRDKMIVKWNEYKNRSGNGNKIKDRNKDNGTSSSIENFSSTFLKPNK